MMEYTILTKCDEDGKLSKVIEWEKGQRIEIPITKTGEVKWFDDSKLIRGGEGK